MLFHKDTPPMSYYSGLRLKTLTPIVKETLGIKDKLAQSTVDSPRVANTNENTSISSKFLNGSILSIFAMRAISLHYHIK